MNLKLLLIPAFLLAILTSCYTRERCNERFPCSTITEQKKDSSTTVKDSTAIRDSLARIAADSTELELDLYYICDSLNQARGLQFKSDGDRSSAEVIVKEKKIYIKCKCDEELIKLQIKDHYRTIVTSVSTHDTKLVYAVPEKPKLPGIVKFFMWSGIIFWILVLIAIIWATRKWWLKLLLKISPIKW